MTFTQRLKGIRYVNILFGIAIPIKWRNIMMLKIISKEKKVTLSYTVKVFIENGLSYWL